MTLADVSPPMRCRILQSAATDADLQTRLYALGLFPAVVIDVLRRAPLGDPIQVKVGHALLSVRKRDASLIEVE